MTACHEIATKRREDAAPKGMVFEPFWPENGYRFSTCWSQTGYGYRGNVHESYKLIFLPSNRGE